jgi:hypothetical protein
MGLALCKAAVLVAGFGCAHQPTEVGKIRCGQWVADHERETPRSADENAWYLSDLRISRNVKDDVPIGQGGWVSSGFAVYSMTKACEAHPSQSIERVLPLAVKKISEFVLERIT